MFNTMDAYQKQSAWLAACQRRGITRQICQSITLLPAGRPPWTPPKDGEKSNRNKFHVDRKFVLTHH